MYFVYFSDCNIHNDHPLRRQENRPPSFQREIQSGHSYIQVGRRFLLLEVEEVSNHDCYEVTDPEEEKQLMAALNENNPILSEEEIKAMIDINRNNKKRDVR